MEISKDNALGPGAKFASAVHAIFSTLSEVSFLKPYTTPIEVASKMGYEFAKEHGLSRPENTKSVTRVRDGHLFDLAQTDRADTSEILALDSANTLSIDPQTVNLDQDEMDILTLAKRKSFFFTTTIAVVAQDSVIASFRVRPSVAQTYGVSFTEYHYPIVSFCSLPFGYWRGTLKYTFQFVASAYHKGRFRITWDPYPSATNMVDSNFFNTTYTQVLDLEGDRELTFSVPYAHFKPYLANTRYSADFSTSAILVPSSSDNGVISVMCLSPLVSPNTTSFQPIYMNVYLSAGDDFSLAYPDDDKLTTLSYFSTSATDVVEPLDDSHEHQTEILKSIPYPCALVANGENIMSIRALTKRVSFCYTKSVSVTASAASMFFSLYLQDFDRPLFRGNGTDGNWTYSTFTPNLSTHNFITHFEPCFVGRKGGYKVKYVPFFVYSNNNQITPGLYSPISLQKVTIGDSSKMDYGSVNIASYTTQNDYKRDYYGLLNSRGLIYPALGAGMIKYGSDNVVDASLPYYGDRKFLCARVINNPGTKSSGSYGWGNATRVSTFNMGATSSGTYNFSKFVSTRDDYSLFFYLSSPVCYYSAFNSPP